MKPGPSAFRTNKHPRASLLVRILDRLVAQVAAAPSQRAGHILNDALAPRGTARGQGVTSTPASKTMLPLAVRGSRCPGAGVGVKVKWKSPTEIGLTTTSTGPG